MVSIKVWCVIFTPFTGTNLKQRCWYRDQRKAGFCTSGWSVVGQSFRFCIIALDGLHRLVAFEMAVNNRLALVVV